MDFIDQEFLAQLTDQLSRNGELSFEEELRSFAGVWSNSDKIKLYEYLRENGERWELEWRPQFVEILGIGEELLPPVQDHEFWGTKLFALIDDGDLRKLQAFVEETAQLDQQFDPDKAYKEGRKYNKHLATIVPFEFYPIQAYNDDCEYAEPYARRRGKIEIADFLRASIESLSSRWKDAYNEGYRREMARRRTFRIVLQDDGLISYNGVTKSLDELVAQAVHEGANFLVMQISKGSKAATAWVPIHLAFHKAGIADFENDWIH